MSARTLKINDDPVTVAGVLPASFDMASVFAPGSHFDLYFPFPLSNETNRWGNTMAIVGRLKPGVSIGSAQAEMKILAGQMTRAHPERNDFEGIAHSAGGTRERPHPAGVAGAGMRGGRGDADCVREPFQPAAGPDRDTAEGDRHPHRAGGRTVAADPPDADRKRDALVLRRGAGRDSGRGRNAYFDATWRRSVSRCSATSAQTSRCLAFCLAAAALTGVVFGLAPALQVPVNALHDVLKDTTRGSTAGKSRNWIRSVLVVSEIAFACVLLVSAGLLVRSFLRVLDVNLGFRPEHAATVRVDPDASYSTQAQQNAYFDDVLRRVRDIPGIGAAGLTDALPLGRNRSWGAPAKGQAYARGKFPSAFVRVVSDGYLKAMGIALIAGRDISERDVPSSQPVIVINETLARTLWPGQRRDRSDYARLRRAPGGGRGWRREAPSARARVRAWRCICPCGNAAISPPWIWSCVATLPPADLAASVRAALKPIAPNLPGQDFRTLQQLVDKAVSPRRFLVALLGGFALFALLLASLGIYGVVSYGVTQRTQEIGIRMALGASASRLQAGIIAHTLGLAAIGMLIGAVASALLARALGGLLFGVTATDPLTFLAMPIVLALRGGDRRLSARAPRVADRSIDCAACELRNRFSYFRLFTYATTSSAAPPVTAATLGILPLPLTMMPLISASLIPWTSGDFKSFISTFIILAIAGLGVPSAPWHDLHDLS